MTDINASGHYTPERGYKDGWHDRMNGKPSMAPIRWGNATTDHAPYWTEYRIGYQEACDHIILKARHSIQEDKQFLAE
jgi:hypothetical protein